MNGTPVTGAVEVRCALLNTALSLIAAPGGLLTSGRGGTLVPLVSNGMVSATRSHQGVEVQPVRYRGVPGAKRVRRRGWRLGLDGRHGVAR